jgi:hypothetical protein
MVDSLRDDLTCAVFIEPINHHAIKACQTTDLSSHLSIYRRQSGLTFNAQRHRSQNGKRSRRLADGRFELKDDFSAGLVNSDVESRFAWSETLTIEALNNSHAACNL